MEIKSVLLGAGIPVAIVAGIVVASLAASADDTPTPTPSSSTSAPATVEPVATPTPTVGAEPTPAPTVEVPASEVVPEPVVTAQPAPSKEPVVTAPTTPPPVIEPVAPAPTTPPPADPSAGGAAAPEEIGVQAPDLPDYAKVYDPDWRPTPGVTYGTPENPWPMTRPAPED